MTRKLSILAIGVLAFLLAACGGGGGGTGGGGTTTLDQTYNQDGLSFKYPTGWVTGGGAGQAYVASNQAALDKAQSGEDVPSLNAGDRVVAVLSFGSETASLMGATSPVELLRSMAQSFSDASLGVTLGEPTEATIGGKPAARVAGSNDNLDAHLIVINLGDSGYAMVMGIAPKGEMSGFESTLNGITETVTVTPAASG
jgi:hypothetical protein